MKFKKLMSRDNVVCGILGISVVIILLYVGMNTTRQLPADTFESKQIALKYDKEIWTLEDQSDSSGTYICLTQGDAKTSQIGLIIEAYSEPMDPNELMDMYKTSFAENLQATDMKLASQASYDKSWASLSGNCMENTKQVEMKFNVQSTATSLGTFISTLMWELDTPDDTIASAMEILDTIEQQEIKEPESISEKTLDQLTEEDLAGMSWEEMESVMRRSFEYTTFKTLPYHDGAYMAITLDGVEPNPDATERSSSTEGITFTQRLGNLTELEEKSLKDFLQSELESQGAVWADFSISELSASEDQAQAAAIYTYTADGEDFMGVTTYQLVSSDAYIANNILMQGSKVSDEAETTFKELCILLQISITMEDLENANS